MVAYERWSLTRGSNYITVISQAKSHFQEMVVYATQSHGDVRPYFVKLKFPNERDCANQNNSCVVGVWRVFSTTHFCILISCFVFVFVFCCFAVVV